MNDRLNTREKVGIAVIVMMVAVVIVLSVFLGIMSYDRTKYRTGTENVYRHAYYSLMDNYMNIETGLMKASASSGSHMLEEIMRAVAENSALASLSLSTLNTEGNDLGAMLKFTNQVGDYATYIVKGIERGRMPTEGERETLAKMHSIARKIGEALESVRDEVSMDSYHFVDNLGKADDSFSMAIRDLEHGSVEYPALIYDGPFSDSIASKMPRNLTGDSITVEAGMAKIKEFVREDARVTHIATNSNKFASYLYDVSLASGASLTVQVSEIGGHILMFDSYVADGEEKVDKKEAIAIGARMLGDIGYEDMESVYVSHGKGVYYINYAPKVDGVIYYPDLVKVKISHSTGKVVGMEALSYYYNHIPRDIDKTGIVSESEAVGAVAVNMDITDVRLALIPLSAEREVLTYEVVGMVGDTRYYIYLDAITGDEVNVLMEIDSGGGNLLI